MNRAMALRAKLQGAQIRFDTVVTADYGNHIYTFSLSCKTDDAGDLHFTVTAPASIAGITGLLSASGGELTFDDTALAFGSMAEGQISPLYAPMTMLRALRSGYLSTCFQEAGCLRIGVSDSYAKDALYLDIWLDSQDLPKRAEILWDGRRILSMDVTNFVIV
jgi:hypothetical protein